MLDDEIGGGGILDIFVVFTLDAKLPIGCRSVPIEFLPSSFASTSVVPEPQNGSNTTSLDFVNSVIMIRGIWGMNLAGKGWKL